MLKRRLEEWALWYHENRDRSRDYDKEREFLHTALDGVLELLALVVQRVDASAGERLLWTPRGITVRGDLSRVD